MKDVPRALEIAARVRDALPESVPVTVKLRKSFDDEPENADHLFELLEGLFSLGISAVTLHGRTVRQRYTGTADWDVVCRAARFVHDRGGTIIGSGDLFTAQTVLDRIRQTGIDGAAIARGAIGNPWIFRDLNALFAGKPLPPPPTVAEQYEVVREHWHLSEELYGYRRASTEMRKFFLKYADWHPRKEELRMAFVRFRSAAELDAVLKEFYESAETS